MSTPDRVVLSPLRLAGGIDDHQLAAIAEAVGLDGSPTVVSATLAGDVAFSHALDREFAREGMARDDLESADRIARMRAFEDAACAEAEAVIESHTGGAGPALERTDADAIVDAARAAFVRLFEAGVLRSTDRVVDRCPRCGTVVEAEDVEAADVDGDLLTVEFPSSDGAVVAVRMHAIELLPGVAAVAVAAGDDAIGREVRVPLTGATVPVLASDVTTPRAIVPWHDQFDQDQAWAAGLVGTRVLDDAGLVVAEGPLFGVSRFAARAAARALLDAEGAIADVESVLETVGRCRWCGTVVVPVRVHGWFVEGHQLEIDAADAVRNGTVEAVPASARDLLIDLAGRHGLWSMTTDIPGAPPAPVSVCADCGQQAVGLDPASSCRKCMGPVSSAGTGLAPRFVAAMWGLVRGASDDQIAWAMSTPADLGPWLLRTIALGLSLAGQPVFERVIVVAGEEAQ